MTTATTLDSTTRRPQRGAIGLRLALIAALFGGAAVAANGAGGTAPAAAQEAAPATAGVVPESALVYLTVNLDFESDQWLGVDGLLGRVGFPTAVDDGRRLLDEELRRDPATAGIEVDDLLGGELGIVISEPAVSALFAPSATSQGAVPSLETSEASPVGSPLASPAASTASEPATGVAAVLSANDPDAAFALLDREFRADGVGSAGGIEEIDYRGTTIAAGGGGALARVDDLVLVAATPADLEPLIDTAAGETAPLTAFGPMTDALAALNDETALFGFVNGERIGDALTGIGLDPAVLVASVAAISPDAAAAASLDFHAGFALWADDPGLRFDTVTVPPPGGSLPPAPANAATMADERVTADSLYFAAGNDLGANGSLDVVALALAAALTEGMGEATGATPPVGTTDDLSPAAIDERFAAAERILGFDLRADLFDRMVGEYALAFSAGDVFRGEGLGFVFASGVDEPPVVADTMRRIARLMETAGAGMLDVRTHQVEGETVFDARVLGREDGIAVTSPPLEFGVVDEQVVIGLGSGMDDYAVGPADPLADDEQYRRVMATLPSEHYQVAYLDLRWLASPLGALLGSIDLSPADGGPADADPACAAHDDVAAAQAAYDADPVANGALDADFDDLACEDFVAGDGAAATPAVPDTAGGDGNLSALQAIGFAAFNEGNTRRSSTILYIAEEEAPAAATPTP